jgi:hypothetical protein
MVKSRREALIAVKILTELARNGGAGMTPSDSRSSWIALIAIVVGLVASLAGCAEVGPVTQITVPDVKSVTGTWKGVVYRSGSEPDYVTLTIKDDGSFDVVSAQRDGSSSARGKVVIAAGRILLEGAEGGHGVATLLKNPAGELVMNVEGTLSDNSTLTAQLFPIR